MDKRETLKNDLQKIINKLKAQGKEFSYIGMSPMDESSFRLRLKADWFDPKNRWDALNTISDFIFDMRENGEIKDETFDAIMAIDVLFPEDPEDENSIPLEYLSLTEKELVGLSRFKELLFPNKEQITATSTRMGYHYYFVPTTVVR